MKNVILKIGILFGVAAILISCDRTKIISSYEAPSVDKKYSNIYVVGISEESTPHSQMEDNMVDELEKKGYVAAADEDTFDPNMEFTDENRSKIEGELNDRGYDAILTFFLVDVDRELDFVSGAYTPGYYPEAYGYYNDYWGYYSHYAPAAYDPDYYTSSLAYYMEANLYDVETGKLVWAARSETVQPASAYSFSNNFAEMVANELKKKDIIANKENTAMKK